MFESSSLLPFGFGIGGHFPIIIEVNTMIFLGESPVKKSSPKLKILQIWIPIVQGKYLVLCDGNVDLENTGKYS